MFKVLDCGIVVSEFDLHLHYYVHFTTNTLGKGFVAERTFYFCLPRKLIDCYGRRIFSPNEDDLSYSAWTIFPDNIKMVKAH